MEVNDEQLLSLLSHPEHRVRSAALECLAASFCESTQLLDEVFDAWDAFGAVAAYPEFPMLSHIPVDKEHADESLLRASAMCRERKLVDPVCRCAGKLIEAYSIAPPTAYAGLLHRFENLHRESKIFFRVDVESMRKRLKTHEQSTADLMANVEASYQLEALEVDQSKLRHCIDELNDRNEAESIWETAFEAIEGDHEISVAVLDACLQLLSRRRVHGMEEHLVRLLDHADSKISDAAVLGLARARTMIALDAISAEFERLNAMAQLRAVLAIQRMRFPGVSSRIRWLKESARDGAVIEALKIAELLQFDFDAVEDWLEALLTIDDRSLRRVEQRLHLAIPLADQLEPSDRSRFMKLFRSRLVASDN